MHISDFTDKEKDAINAIYARDLKDLTPEEVELFGKWNAAVELGKAEFEAEQKRKKEESDALINELKASAALSRKNLNDLKDAALARLERIDEQTKQK